MYSLALLASSSFLLAFVLTPLCRNLFRRWGWLDHPDKYRKLHSHPIPRVGGLPLLAAYAGAFAVLLASHLTAARLAKAALPLVSKMLPAATLVFAAGLLDDLRGLKPSHKLALQVIASYVAFKAGIGITGLGKFVAPPWLSLTLTVLWLVGCCNAFNLIDGVDGLAAGAGLFASVTMLLGALLNNDIRLLMAIVPLAGALLGFLRYNFNPASIFLGDSGSLTLGFLLGCYGIVWNQKSTTVLGITAPLMALALPLLDTGISIARRFLRQQPIFIADAGHIHHRLLARGLTPRRVVLLLYCASGLAAVMSLLASVSQDGFKTVIIILFCGVTWIGVQHLGYVEFGVAGRMFANGAFRSHLKSHITLHTLEQTLVRGRDPQEHWRAICEACRRFGFARVGLSVDGHFWTNTLVETNGASCWSIEVPLADGSSLFLNRKFGHASNPSVLAAFAEILHKNFEGGPVYANFSRGERLGPPLPLRQLDSRRTPVGMRE